jgi:BON domain
MRRYQKWLSMGLLAITPHLALADGAATPGAPSAASKANPNQDLAQRVAKSLDKSLKSGKLRDFDIDIDVRGGVVTLTGSVRKADQKAAAEKAVRSVAGVTRVVNRLELAEAGDRDAVQQAVASESRTAGRSARNVRQVNAERSPYDGIAPQEGPALVAPPVEPSRMALNQAPPQALVPVPQGPVPQAAGAPAGAAPAAVPQAAGPAYCPPGAMMGPGYSPPGAMMGGGAPGYGMGMGGPGGPGQVAASQYPYTGPYYPYPQIPRGWRKVSLELDDGYWNLNFRSRTDKWWWYMNPKNW